MNHIDSENYLMHLDWVVMKNFLGMCLLAATRYKNVLYQNLRNGIRIIVFVNNGILFNVAILTTEPTFRCRNSESLSLIALAIFCVKSVGFLVALNCFNGDKHIS